MIQEIITYILIATAVGAALWKLWLRFAPRKEEAKCDTLPNEGAAGCSGCEVECPFNKNTIILKKK